jgi:hypothetical protein
MKVNRKAKIKILTICLAALITISFAFTGDGGRQTAYKTTFKAGEAYRLFINNIDMPMNREGVMANVAINGPEGGKLDGKEFLFSGGFFLSGKTGNLTWANAVASASRIQDYLPGTYEFGSTDPRAQLYVLRQKDGDFANSWEEWRDAVALGAYFHDGDGDGEYNPVDLNNNGKWDPDEDRPDLIGDETVWCVYQDAVDPALRRFNNIDPQGIEIRQTVFALASKGVTGNMIFLRYSILNTGLKADVIDSVYFGVWADPDLGNANDAYLDDLVGCDTLLNAGFTYNSGDDNEWGPNPPCFIIDFFQGPISYIPGVTFVDIDGDGEYTDGVDTPLETAYNVQGQVRGIGEFPGARNLGLSSFVHYMQSHPTVGDPAFSYEARNYMLGLDKLGNHLDPCLWTFGEVRGGVPCTDVDDKFWYSGDPVSNVGWINIFETDQRQMSNTGPFQLVKDKPVDIWVAYVIATGNGPINAITVARQYDLTAQLIFDNNFPSPPAPPATVPVVKNGSDFFDITWETSEQFNYRAVDTVLSIDRQFQAYYITAFKTNSKALTVNGLENARDIRLYEKDNFIKSVYQIAENGGQNLIIPESAPEYKLDPSIYQDPATGRIKLRIQSDPFTGQPLIKGHEYYFTITQVHLNHAVVVNRSTGTYGPPGDYYDPSGNGIEEFDIPMIVVTFGEDQYAPAEEGIAATPGSSNPSLGEIKVLVVDNELLTGQDYEVEFFEDSKQPEGEAYLPFWKLKNISTGAVLIDSSKIYNFDSNIYAGVATEGFTLRVKPLTAELDLSTVNYEPASNRWFSSYRADSSTGIYYVGNDIPQGSAIATFHNKFSSYISADRLRRVELRFGAEGVGKAYRYINGYKQPPPPAANSYPYAEALTSSDTVGRGIIGNWDEVNNRPFGFVDVPFTAWIKDDVLGEEYQLAVGFVERRRTGTFLFGNPDGKWDPSTNILQSGEVIIIFDHPYDPNGGHMELTGGVFQTPSGPVTVWSDLMKQLANLPNIPADAIGITEEQKEIFKSPWFNALYVVNLQRLSPTSWFQSGDKLIVPVIAYPYTSADKFNFSTTFKGELTFDEKKALFEKVNVFPNPLFGFNPATSYRGSNPDDVFVSFSNLPEEVTIKIYTLAGTLIRTLTTADKPSPTSTFLRWNLLNEDGLRAASGLYLAMVSSPEYGEKILKFSIIMPQKQIQRY